MQIREYQKPATLDEAYALLVKGKTNRILGGCTFLKRTNVKIGTAIDLSACGLDYIRETEEAVMIGAYTSLRDIETSAVILENFGPALREVLEHLIGVQLRNVITIGAHVASRFGFSDIIPTLLAMNASLRFYRGGVKSLWAYMNEDVPERDILLEIVLPKEGRRTKVQMMRLSYNDYSIFCLAASRVKENWIIAAGVFPGRAKLAEKTMSEMRDTPVTRGRLRSWPGGSRQNIASVRIIGVRRNTAVHCARYLPGGQLRSWQMKIHVKCNGKQQEWDVTPNEYLADTLRSHGCPSVKISCGDGACGTCTVLLNGKPIVSCEYLSVRADGAEIVTVEGLGSEADKIVECLTRYGGEGCGYCAPGFVVLAYALKRELKNPTYDEVKAYLDGNLCRCTGYIVRIEAVLDYLKLP